MIKINIDIFRNNIKDYALTFINKKYTWGANGPNEFDSPGFTWYVFKILFNKDINKDGYGIDNTTNQMTNNIGSLKVYIEDDNNKKEYLNDIKIGDLIFFHQKSLDDDKPLPNNEYPGHVGIYIGDNKFIHSSSNDEKIVINTLDKYWLKIMVASRDIISGIL